MQTIKLSHVGYSSTLSHQGRNPLVSAILTCPRNHLSHGCNRKGAVLKRWMNLNRSSCLIKGSCVSPDGLARTPANTCCYGKRGLGMVQGRTFGGAWGATRGGLSLFRVEGAWRGAPGHPGIDRSMHTGWASCLLLGLPKVPLPASQVVEGSTERARDSSSEKLPA